MDHFLGLMAQPVNRLKVVDIGVITPSAEEQQDAALYARRAQKTVASHCGAELSPLSCYDSFNLTKVRRTPSLASQSSSELYVLEPEAEETLASAALTERRRRSSKHTEVADSIAIDNDLERAVSKEFELLASEEAGATGDADRIEAQMETEMETMTEPEKEKVVQRYWKRRTSMTGMIAA